MSPIKKTTLRRQAARAVKFCGINNTRKYRDLVKYQFGEWKIIQIETSFTKQGFKSNESSSKNEANLDADLSRENADDSGMPMTAHIAEGLLQMKSSNKEENKGSVDFVSENTISTPTKAKKKKNKSVIDLSEDKQSKNPAIDLSNDPGEPMPLSHSYPMPLSLEQIPQEIIDYYSGDQPHVTANDPQSLLNIRDIDRLAVSDPQFVETVKLQEVLNKAKELYEKGELLNDKTILVRAYGIDFLMRNAYSLIKGQWASDNHIDIYMSMLHTRCFLRSQILPADRKLKQIFYHTTKLSALTNQQQVSIRPARNGMDMSSILEPPDCRNYKIKIARAMHKDIPNLFTAYSRVFFPANTHNNHWMLFVIDNMEKKIIIADSIYHGRENKPCQAAKDQNIRDPDIDTLPDVLCSYTAVLKRLLVDFSKWNKDTAFDINQWQTIYEATTSNQQSNGSDCGYHVMLNADYMSDFLPRPFYTEKQMHHFRTKVGCDIFNKHLRY